MERATRKVPRSAREARLSLVDGAADRWSDWAELTGDSSRDPAAQGAEVAAIDAALARREQPAAPPDVTSDL